MKYCRVCKKPISCSLEELGTEEEKKLIRATIEDTTLCLCCYEKKKVTK